MKNIVIILLFLSAYNFSQNNYTSPELIQKSENQYKIDLEKSIVKNIKFENIGPSVMSGRVTDIEVNPNSPTEFYVAYASGGLWHTTNNGTTFTPIMDNSITQNIGDFDVDWSSRTIYVGTGESNSSRSSYPGIGILKSINNGESWANVGLRDSHHISRVLINPTNNQHIVVAVIGHLYTENVQRGIYNSYDGGKTWSNSLFISDNTGAIDLVHDPNNFDVQYASFWERSRTSWNFKGSGNNSAIYKTVDGGKNWKKLTTKNSGFPLGEGVGRIGLAIYDSSTIYAVLDNQFRRDLEKKSEGIQRIDFKNMLKDEFFSLDKDELNTFLRKNNFPKDISYDSLKLKISSDEISPEDIYKFLTDANAELFDTPVIGAEVYKSVDGGINWQKQNNGYLDAVYNSYGYYFGRIHVSPTNPEQIYIYGVPILKSNDSGSTFQTIGASNVHVDHHDLWINPKDTNHLVLGNDGGVNISYDQGENWIKLNQPSVGQFYSINVDNSEPYNVYGGLQDNGVWMAKNNSYESPEWYESGHNNWTKIMGGDGMQIQIDNRDNNIVYTGLQFGNYYRLNLTNKSKKNIKPGHKFGDSPLRFNWQTPILLSSHNQDILYLGSNKLHRSFDKGDTWQEISDDLTNGGIKGNVPFGTITSFDESIFQFGKIIVGSDDGKISITNNSGDTWKQVSNNLPKNLWVSRVIFSKQKKNRIYVSLNGYRLNDFTPYLFVSDDNGLSWDDISSNLPLSPLNVIKEDFNKEEILYVGTDNGAFISLDSGKKWHPFTNLHNRVAVHDIVIHKESNELLLATHGRSIYKTKLKIFMDYFNNKASVNKITIVNIDNLNYSNNWGMESNINQSVSLIYDKPQIDPRSFIQVDLFSESSDSIKFKILNNDKRLLSNGEIKLDKGFNRLQILPVADKSLNQKQRQKLGLTLKKAADGNVYFNKGKYIFSINNTSKEFLVK